jgi:hypothetical protein
MFLLRDPFFQSIDREISQFEVSVWTSRDWIKKAHRTARYLNPKRQKAHRTARYFNPKRQL